MVKSKQIKLLRKQVAAATRVSYKVEDHMSSANAQDLEIISSKQTVENDLLKACLQLFEANMGDLYRNSSWGLHMDEKQDEWTHSTSRWIVLRKSDKNLAAFCNYRFLVEEDVAVLYVYELQVRLMRQGYGKRLMEAMESIARTVGLDKVVLTVFVRNTAAREFYRALHYACDENSPDDEDYVILSKRI